MKPAQDLKDGWIGGTLALLVLTVVLVMIGASVVALRSSHASKAGGSTPTQPIPNATGGVPKSSKPTPEAEPVWLPKDQAFLMDLTTQQRRHLPFRMQSLNKQSIYSANDFQVSPDGTRFAFNGSSTICVARVDGSRLRVLTDASDESAPSWSPNSKRLVFEDEGNVYVVDLASRRTRQVISGDRWVYHPNFSSDGQRILFTRRYGDALALWTVPVTGGHPTLLARRAAFGSYSPDGASIVFRRTHFDGQKSVDGGFDGGDATQMTNSNLLIVNADGSHRRPLSVNPGGMSQIDATALWPMWSPDGTRIAYETLYSRGVSVWDLRTGASRHITDGTHPSWLDNHVLIVEGSRW